MQRSDLRTELQTRFFDTSNAIASTATLNRWLNLAVQQIGGSHNWPFHRKRDTETLSSGNPLVALNSDLRVITKVSYEDASGARVPLVPVHERWLQDNYPDDGDTGAPVVYTDGGFEQATTTAPPVRQLRVAPVPDQNYTLTVSYMAQPTMGAGDTAYPPFPAEFDECILLWGCIQYARLMNDIEARQDYQRSYEEELKRLIARYSSWQAEVFERVSPEEVSRTYLGMVWE